MKPPVFEYAIPRTVEEAVDAAGERPEETTLLAGGQSLVPLLNMRMSQPRLLVDLNGVQELVGIEETPEGRVRIGAMVRQRRLETDPLVRERLPLMTEAARHIAHVPIRTRGTVGGSLAHADPAAELPSTVTALEASVLVRGAGGVRAVPASELFLGPLMSAVEPGEVLIGIEVEPPPPKTGWAFLEVARTHGAFALAGAAALVHTGADGRIDLIRLCLCGVGGTPHVPPWLDEVARDEQPTDALFAEIGDRLREEVEPFDDIHATAAYRKRVAGVLAARALRTAAQRSGESQ